MSQEMPADGGNVGGDSGSYYPGSGGSVGSYQPDGWGGYASFSGAGSVYNSFIPGFNLLADPNDLQPCVNNGYADKSCQSTDPGAAGSGPVIIQYDQAGTTGGTTSGGLGPTDPATVTTPAVPPNPIWDAITRLLTPSAPLSLNTKGPTYLFTPGQQPAAAASPITPKLLIVLGVLGVIAYVVYKKVN